MTHYFSQQIPILKALADEERLKIVQMLTCETMCANSILECFSMSQPSLSYHMKILTQCGLVLSERQGGYTMYRANPAALAQVRALMDTLLSGSEIAAPQA
ncbi:MAG: metalloregulator ArsR/SmtB family transcription factor [Eubacteriales bacterium]|nr:metalloregulator ArsR/SmtB family transcription factor [Eubacteriales bacterium]